MTSLSLSLSLLSLSLSLSLSFSLFSLSLSLPLSLTLSLSHSLTLSLSLSFSLSLSLSLSLSHTHTRTHTRTHTHRCLMCSPSCSSASLLHPSSPLPFSRRLLVGWALAHQGPCKLHRRCTKALRRVSIFMPLTTWRVRVSMYLVP